MKKLSKEKLSAANAELEKRNKELEHDWAVMARACGNWREWPTNTISKDAPNYEHDDWKAAAKAILERDQLKQAIQRVLRELFNRSDGSALLARSILGEALKEPA